MNKRVYVVALGATLLTHSASAAQLVGCDFSDAAVFNQAGGAYDNSAGSTDDIDPADGITVSDWSFSNGGGFTNRDNNAQNGMPNDQVTKIDGAVSDAVVPALDADPSGFSGVSFSIDIPAGLIVDLTSVTFDWRKATGSGNVRWLAFQTSLDSELLYSQNGQTRNNVDSANIDLTGALYQGLSDQTVTFYWYAGGEGSGDVDFDTVIVNGDVSFLDDDNDGVGDLWEERWFGDNSGTIEAGELDFTDGTGNGDGDTLDDKAEFDYGTDPTKADTDDDGLDDGVEDTNLNLTYDAGSETDPLNPDTDDDGLLDGVEDNGGVFVSAMETGTDPLIADTDNDTFLDSEENGSGVFNGVGDPGTDPNKRDTDDDGLDDDEEALAGLDPNLGNADGESSAGAGDGPNGANGDPDEDGSLNLDEVRFNGTDPLDPDSDDDGLNDGEEETAGTDPLDPDSDADGLNDKAEVDLGTNPLVQDSDLDGLLDGVEVDNGLNPLVDGSVGESSAGAGDGPDGPLGDPDNDTLNNQSEVLGFSTINGVFFTTDPLKADTDDDGYNDPFETGGGTFASVTNTGTDPSNPDTDDDGLLDGVEDNGGTFVSETQTGTNPNIPDTDGDGLLDGVETGTGTFVDSTNTGSDPHVVDSDGDGLTDSEEVANGIDPNADGSVGESSEGAGDGPDGPLGDPDGDTLTNEDEIFGFATINGVFYVTDPLDADTDDDGYGDQVETGGGTFTSLTDTGTSPLDPDTDRDCLLDGVETNTGTFNGDTDTGTNPHLVDTDADGYQDGTEVLYGTDPTDGGVAPNPALLPDILFLGGSDPDVNGEPAGAGDIAAFYLMSCRFGYEAITYLRANVAPSAAIGRDVVVLSSTPGSGDYRDRFPNVAVPMVNWEEAVADNDGGEFGMCDSMVKTGGATPTTQMTLVEHPITAGLPETINLFSGATGETTCTPDLFAGLTAVGTAVDGEVTGGAGATIGDPVAGNTMLFIAEAGDALDPAAGVDDNVAPARRVMFPATDGTLSLVSADFAQLFLQAVEWAAGGFVETDIRLLDPNYVAGAPNTVIADLGAPGTVDIYRSTTGVPGSWVATGATGLSTGNNVVIDPDAPALPSTTLYIAVPEGGTAP